MKKLSTAAVRRGLQNMGSRHQSSAVDTAGSRLVRIPGIAGITLLLGFRLAAPAQTLQQTAPGSGPQAVPGAVPGIDYTLVARDGNQKVWAKTIGERNAAGELLVKTNSFTELASGMSHLVNGNWADSSDQIAITRTGAQATNSQHNVAFLGNINAVGAIDLGLPEGKHLVGNVIGLSFLDAASGKSVLIAELKDSIGQLLPSGNEVVYPDAFTDIRADILYQNRIDRVEQLILLRSQIPSPAEWGLSEESSFLQVLTEFIDPPEPQITKSLVGGVVDEHLNFGIMQMGRGIAFALGSERAALEVTKQWLFLDQRHVLVEQVPFKLLQPMLDELPRPSERAALRKHADSPLHLVANRHLLPVRRTRRGSLPSVQVAAAPLSGHGFAIDWTAVISATNFVFKSDTLYYVSGTANLSGTNTTFEGAAVIKYAPTNSPRLNISSPITWLGSAYRPVVMTARDDDTVGGTMSGSTGNPSTNYYANPALYIDAAAAGTNAVLQNLRIAYAQSAIVLNGGTGHVVGHAQLVNCANGFTATNTDFSVRNALLYNVSTNFNGASSTSRCEHLTIDTANWLNCNSALTLTLTNSLLLSVTNTGSYTANSVSTATASSFQTLGAASHYISDSGLRNAGTTSINAGLAADLRRMTTYPPLELTTDFTVDTTLSLQAARDSDAPDLGYHYWPLDYVVSGRTITNSTLTLTNGVAIGIYGTSPGYGFQIRKGGILVSEGSPVNLNQIAGYNTVQEQSNTNWVQTSSCVTLYGDPAPVAQAKFRFTRFSLAMGRSYNVNASFFQAAPAVQCTDCQFGPGYVWANPMSSALTNNLFERTYLYLNDSSSSVNYYAFNNLFHAGTIDLQMPVGNCQFKDNYFEKASISQNGSITHNYNGYVQGSNRLTPNGANDKILTNTPVYLSSYLGNYYYPTNDGMLATLIDAGSRYATNVGLYHYTTAISQAKEAGSKVDIGFHYVACDANGNPLIDGDGSVPDYAADKNGNGVLDFGEVPFAITIDNPANGSVINK